MRFSIIPLFAIALSDIACGQTLTETESFSFVPTGSAKLTFDKFDTLGDTRILQSMKVTVSFTRSGGSLAVDNDSMESGIVTLTHQVSGGLTSAAPFLTSDFGSVINSSTFYAESSTTHLIGSTSGDSTTGFDRTDKVDYYYWAPADAFVSQSGEVGSLFFSNYTGTGTFDLNFSATQIVNAVGTSGLQQAITVANVAGSVMVEYTFLAVPEVTTSCLSIVSIAGFCLRRRRAR